MKSYFAYIRVSTVKQGEHGSSLQEQKSAIEAYAARHQLRIGDWFEERETAAKQGRKEFAKLTGLLRRGKAAGVIIHKIDRGARNLKDWAGLGELIDVGIEVLFAHEGLDMQTRGGRLAADIQAVVAADFIRNLRDEVRKGFYGRLKQGFYPLKAPRGYLDRGKAKSKEICPIAGPLVRQAFELYGSGNYSLELLRHEMASRGLTSHNGVPLGYEALSLILRNPFYVGLMRLRSTGEMFEGNHVPLVSKRLFDRVQAIMDGRLYPRVEKHRFRFRRLLTCGTCGRSLSGECQKGHIYYRCHDRGCRGVSVSEASLDEHVRATLGSLAFSPRDVRDLRDMLRVLIAQERQNDAAGQAHVERNLALVDRRLARLTDALLDDMIDKDVFEERKRGLLMDRCALRDRRQEDLKLTFWRDVAERFELALEACLSYETGGDEEKRGIVRSMSSNFVVNGKNPELRLSFPYREIRNWAILLECAPHQRAVRTLTSPERRRLRRWMRDLHAGASTTTATSPKSPHPYRQHE